MAFVKLDCRMLESSLWEDIPGSRVFLTCAMMAVPFVTEEPMQAYEVESLTLMGWSVPPDLYGFVNAALSGIARKAMLCREDVTQALIRLCAPDPESSSPAFDGRRLARVDGGYLVLNYGKYREFDLTVADRVRRWRQKKSANVTRYVTPVTALPSASASVRTSGSVQDGGVGETHQLQPHEAFNAFWEAYPKKMKRGDAEHAFTEVNAYRHIDAIMHAIQVQRASESWTKDGGKFIPNPGNWLRDKQWLDQPVEAAVEQEEYGTPWAVHFGIPKRNGWLLWTRESAGPQREQFGKQPDQERLFKIARDTWQQWAKTPIQPRA